jgi:hypothetical protein
MPTHKQITVEAVSTERANGSSDTATMQALFPASPIHAGELTDSVVHDQGNDLLIDNGVNDGGHTFGTFDRDFADAPNLEDVKTGGGGLPGSPYAPAPGSPGPGSMLATDIPEPPAEWPADPGTEYGSGEGGLVSPSSTSKIVAKQTIGDYLFGKSSS